MGACNFIEFRAAPTAKQAFDELVAEAIWDHGHDPYSGTIATTALMRGSSKVADEWGEEAREKAIGIAEGLDWGEKYESRALDCGACGTDGRIRMWAFFGWASC